MPKKVILDVDTGSDDAVAIMEAVLAHDPDGADRAVAAMVRLFQDTVH